MKITSPTSLLHDSLILDWIDRELVDSYQLSHDLSQKRDILLDLRQHFIANDSSYNKLVGGFYPLLPKVELHSYLLGYRIRQWFSLNFSIQVSDPLNRVITQIKPIYSTLRTLKNERKAFFEHSDFRVPYHDIRIEIVPI